MRVAVLCAAVFAAGLSTVHADQPRTIVGLWSSVEGSCLKDDGATVIGPKSLENIDVACRFATVQRKGNTVTWKGVCDDAEGSGEQTVTATERNGKLTIRYSPGGNVIEGLRRCE
jgi:Protein of unknown function (DUF3617)